MVRMVRMVRMVPNFGPSPIEPFNSASDRSSLGLSSPSLSRSICSAIRCASSAFFPKAPIRAMCPWQFFMSSVCRIRGQKARKSPEGAGSLNWYLDDCTLSGVEYPFYQF